MIITFEYIKKHKRKKGAWTARQLKAIGVSWPPPKGWRHRIVGTEISLEQQKAFEVPRFNEKVKIYLDGSHITRFIKVNLEHPAVVKAYDLAANGKLSVEAALPLFMDVREIKR